MALRSVEIDTMELYQAEVKRTDGGSYMVGITLGIVGEAGEFADAVKKLKYHGVTDFKGKDFLTHAEEEFGDILYYLAYMCNYLSLNLATVARKNIEKLELRYPGGFVPGGGIR